MGLVVYVTDLSRLFFLGKETNLGGLNTLWPILGFLEFRARRQFPPITNLFALLEVTPGPRSSESKATLAGKKFPSSSDRFYVLTPTLWTAKQVMLTPSLARHPLLRTPTRFPGNQWVFFFGPLTTKSVLDFRPVRRISLINCLLSFTALTRSFAAPFPSGCLQISGIAGGHPVAVVFSK